MKHGIGSIEGLIMKDDNIPNEPPNSAARTPAAYGQIINLASGQPVAIREMVQILCRLIGGGLPEFGQVPYRQGENMALYADISKARRLLKWRPEISLEEGLRELIEWGRGQGWAQ